MIINVERFLELLQRFGCSKIRVSGDRIMTQCIFHPDRVPSLSFSIQKEVGYCFGCGVKGTVRTLFYLYAKTNGIKYPELKKELDEILDGYGDYWDMRGFNVSKDQPLKDISYIEKTKGKVPRYVVDKRRISLETCREFMLGFDKTKKRIVFPLRNIDGDIVGYATRGIGSRRDYKFNEGFIKTVVYGEYEISKNPNSKNFLVIVEGFFDVLLLRTYGYNVVGSLGTALTASQYQKIKKMLNFLGWRKVKVFLDGDEIGIKAAKQIADKISGLIIGVATFPEVEVVNCPVGKDPADLSKEEVEKILQ